MFYWNWLQSNSALVINMWIIENDTARCFIGFISVHFAQVHRTVNFSISFHLLLNCLLSQIIFISGFGLLRHLNGKLHRNYILCLVMNVNCGAIDQLLIVLSFINLQCNTKLTGVRTHLLGFEFSKLPKDDAENWETAKCVRFRVIHIPL